MFDGVDTSVRLFFVGADLWPALADRTMPHLVRMAEGSGGRFETADIVRNIEGGHMHLWLVMQGASVLCALVSEIVAYPQLRAMRLVGISGRNSRKWMHLLGSVEECARLHFGCSRMEALHSPGHERLLCTGGWKTWHIFSEKAL